MEEEEIQSVRGTWPVVTGFENGGRTDGLVNTKASKS